MTDAEKIRKLALLTEEIALTSAALAETVQRLEKRVATLERMAQQLPVELMRFGGS